MRKVKEVKFHSSDVNFGSDVLPWRLRILTYVHLLIPQATIMSTTTPFAISSLVKVIPLDHWPLSYQDIFSMVR